MSDYYLNGGLPQPVAGALDAPYWQGLIQNELRIQRCDDCHQWQWGPEWICHHCHSEGLSYAAVKAEGEIYSYERIWHPVHPALADQGAYIVVLVTLPHAGNIRLVGNLLGDAQQTVPIGAQVRGVFEHHLDAEPTFSLLQWRLT